jgi:hypothetical protein
MVKIGQIVKQILHYMWNRDRPQNIYNSNLRARDTSAKVYSAVYERQSCPLCAQGHKAEYCKNLRDDIGNILEMHPTHDDHHDHQWFA